MAKTSSPSAKYTPTGHLHSNNPPLGSVEEVAGLKSYVTGDKAHKAKTVFFITDYYGYEHAHTRRLADEYAMAGFYVIMPDITQNDPVNLKLQAALAPLPSSAEKSLSEKAKDVAALGIELPPWLAKHREQETMPHVYKWVNQLKKDPEIQSLGAVGHSWGGRFAILLTQLDADATVDVAVAHSPAFLAVPTDILTVNKPLLINIGDKDELMSESDIIKCKEVFLKDLKGVRTKAYVYKGMNHDFATRTDLNTDEERQQKTDACEATVKWLLDLM